MSNDEIDFVATKSISSKRNRFRINEIVSIDEIVSKFDFVINKIDFVINEIDFVISKIDPVYTKSISYEFKRIFKKETR